MSSVASTPQYPDRLLSLADWELLPIFEHHDVELVEGVLVVTPKPTLRHQDAMGRLYASLVQLDLPGLAVIQDAEIVFPEWVTVRAPDVLIGERAAVATQPRFAAEQVRLAVEIVSPGSRTTDRVTKLHEYARAGIGEYWILDLEAAELASFALDAGAGVYRATGVHTGTARLAACGQPITIDLNALTTI
ncbi:MAG: Uma2 family endonuclease [Frankiaceae bacterium]|nr:Uma2 family endonuclease [Frankiaceae bacterium]